MEPDLRKDTTSSVQRTVARSALEIVALVLVIGSTSTLLLPFVNKSTAEDSTATLLLLNAGLAILSFAAIRLLIGQVLTEFNSRMRSLESAVSEQSKIEQVGLMTAGLAHNFKNYLGILEGTAALIKHCEVNHSSISRALELQNKCLYEARGMIDQVMHFAKNSELSNEKRIRPLNDVVQEAIELAEILVQGRGIRLSRQLTQESTQLLCNDITLMQSLINIIKNAAEASKDNSEILISTVSKLNSVKPVVAISIKDWGCGMNADQMNEVFSPFRTGKAAGNGLGLLMVKRLVEREGGEVRVNSAPGVGTEVTLEFPLPAVKPSDSGELVH